MASETDWTTTERHARYLLQGLHFTGGASAGLCSWYGQKDMHRIVTDPGHRVNIFLTEQDEDKGDEIDLAAAPAARKPFRVHCLVRSPTKGQFCRSSFGCTESVGVSYMKLMWDDHVLDSRLSGRKPAPQDVHSVRAINRHMAADRDAGYLPHIMVTRKLVLPDADVTKAVTPEAMRDIYRPYFTHVSPDLSAMMEIMGPHALSRVEAHDYGTEATQFMAIRRDAKGGYYQLSAIQPTRNHIVDEIASYDETCLVLRALEAGYIDPAPDQPPIRQHWGQNVRDWSSQRESHQALPPADLEILRHCKAAGMAWQRPLTLARYPIFPS